MIYFKYAASILVALLVCGLQHVVDARRNNRHPHHQFLRNYHPIDSLLSYAENSDILKFFADYSVVEPPQAPLLDYSQSTLAFDAKETNSTYLIVCDLPGIDKKDISLSMKNNELTISAKRNTAAEEDGVTFRRIERQSGEVTRTIVLPDDCEAGKIAAESKDGVLVVSIPKIQKVKEEDSVIHIEVN